MKAASRAWVRPMPANATPKPSAAKPSPAPLRQPVARPSSAALPASPRFTTYNAVHSGHTAPMPKKDNAARYTEKTNAQPHSSSAGHSVARNVPASSTAYVAAAYSAIGQPNSVAYALPSTRLQLTVAPAPHSGDSISPVAPAR